MNKLFLGGIVILLVVAGVLFWMRSGSEVVAPENNESAMEEVTNPPSEEAGQGAQETIIKITKDGFVPNRVTIKVGEAVQFQNESGAGSWPASAMHPTHTVYPGSDIKKCDTPEEVGIFDACRELADGESWSFTFTQKGTWNYHDHVGPTHFGSVVVE